MICYHFVLKVYVISKLSNLKLKIKSKFNLKLNYYGIIDVLNLNSMLNICIRKIIFNRERTSAYTLKYIN